MQPLVQIQHLTRRYGETVAVRDVSLSIRRGEIVGLLGQNGAGKTTVMKVLTGFLAPSAGAVTVDGLDVVTHRSRVQARLGYLPENAPVYPEMLVQDYLLMMAELRGVPEAERVAAVVAAVKETGLEQHLVRPISTLSRGYRQRVGLAQAIVHRPDVLVLDEPTNGLDPLQIVAIRDLIRRLGRTSTVILSTHILQEVEAVCDRVVILIRGELAADAPLSDLMEAPALRLCTTARADDVSARLSAIPGVRRTLPLPGEPAREGFAWYSVDCEAGAAPGPEILQVAATAGWTVDSLSREHRSLQAVFERLQADWVARTAPEEARR